MRAGVKCWQRRLCHRFCPLEKRHCAVILQMLGKWMQVLCIYSSPARTQGTKRDFDADALLLSHLCIKSIFRL